MTPIKRPAEYSTLAGAVVVLLVWLFGLEPDDGQWMAMVMVVGAIPSVVTGIVEWFRKR